jgi:lipopolysaccharide transport system ATP-binding protein
VSQVIAFNDVSKQYRIGEGRGSIREALYRLPRIWFAQKPTNHREAIHNALTNVSFDINQGEALGIIGHNGAGKTTILKLLSNITKPTSGDIYTEGRISALIELGAGFHPDLTGRENVYLNGVILGMSRKEISKRFDEIVAFAEIEEYIDTPVKKYSSGMYARLGFAVAAHVDPEILLVDEVLAVGDEAFQTKCQDFIHTFVKSGRTSIFVSHNLYAIEQLCDRVLWLDHGKIVQCGYPGQILRGYMDKMDSLTAEASTGKAADGRDHIEIQQMRILDADGVETDAFEKGEDIQVELTYRTPQYYESPYFIIWFSDARNNLPLFAANMLLDGYKIPSINGVGKLTCRFNNLPLLPRPYNIWVEVYGQDRAQILFRWRVLGVFRILDNDREATEKVIERGNIRFRRAHGMISVPYEWKI